MVGSETPRPALPGVPEGSVPQALLGADLGELQNAMKNNNNKAPTPPHCPRKGLGWPVFVFLHAGTLLSRGAEGARGSWRPRILLFGACWKQRWHFHLPNACAESASPGRGGRRTWGTPRSPPLRSGVSKDLRVLGRAGRAPAGKSALPAPPQRFGGHRSPRRIPGLCARLGGAGGGRG